MKITGLWIALILADAIAQSLLQLGAAQGTPSAWPPNSLVLGGYGVYLISFLIWMQILKHVRLFIALSASAVVYAVIAVGAHFVFSQEISIHIILGTLLIVAGLSMLVWKKESNHDPDETTE